MPKIVIDNREIDVPKGTKVIEAAEQLGIMIPRFCYLKALGSIGACRLCAVKFLEGPVKGIEMSCMTDVQDGMVVSTTHEEAVEFRKYVIEWLMLNHPHDCPVCDEGGHCLLQDETVSGGHGLRRYPGKKRTYNDQYLGVFVQHEMNRCIHCWRCRRFYQEFAGYRDFGAMQIGNRTYFGRQSDGPLESPFSGNLIDICPTGVYTDKPSRFKARQWETERGPSLCLNCSLGCNIIGNARFREMIRLEARFNPDVNGYFICDRGRYGFYYANLPERQRRARAGGQEAPWARAVAAAAEKISAVIENSGAEAVACLGSSRNSLETQGFLSRFCNIGNFRKPRFFIDPFIERKVRKAVSLLDEELAISMRDIEQADFIIAAGADPVNEAPMLALAMRQAHLNGAAVTVIDPRPVFLPFEFTHVAAAPHEIDSYLDFLVYEPTGDGEEKNPNAFFSQPGEAFGDNIQIDPQTLDRLANIRDSLKKSQRPVIVCGCDIVRETTPVTAAEKASQLKSATGRGCLFYLLPGANAFGAGLLSPPEDESEDIVEAIEKGEIKALLLVESDPFWNYPDYDRLLEALEKLEVLIVLDYLPSTPMMLADIILPTSTVFEKTLSSYVNQEGRLQVASPIHVGGLPISQTNDGDHPPRTFLDHIPGGDPKSAWETLNDLHGALFGSDMDITRESLWDWLQEVNPVFANIHLGKDQPGSVRLLPKKRPEQPSVIARDCPEEDYETEGLIELILVDRTFGTEELSAYSPCIQEAEEVPCLTLHAKDGAELNLSQDDKVALNLPGGTITVKLCTAENMARNVLVLPRHRAIGWSKATERPVMIPREAIEKLQS